MALSRLDSHQNVTGGAADHQYKQPRGRGRGHVKEHGKCVPKPMHCSHGKIKKHGKCVRKTKPHHHGKGKWTQYGRRP